MELNDKSFIFRSLADRADRHQNEEFSVLLPGSRTRTTERYVDEVFVGVPLWKDMTPDTM